MRLEWFYQKHMDLINVILRLLPEIMSQSRQAKPSRIFTIWA